MEIQVVCPPRAALKLKHPSCTARARKTFCSSTRIFTLCQPWPFQQCGAKSQVMVCRQLNPPELTPKQCCNSELSSSPYTLQGNSRQAAPEPLSLPVVTPGEYHMQIKSVKFTVHSEMHHFLPNQQNAAAWLLPRQFSVRGLGGFKG